MVRTRDEHDGAKQEELVGVSDSTLEELQDGLAQEKGTADEKENSL